VPHTNPSDLILVDRRTPLDDAIAEENWLCTKLLLQAGGRFTTVLTPQLQEKIDSVDLPAVRDLIREEKVRGGNLVQKLSQAADDTDPTRFERGINQGFWCHNSSCLDSSA
jgi:hypothetical protein